MTTALIGHTGLVGSNVLRQTSFTDCFHRANIASMDGQAFDLVVCAGVQALKWWANKNPDEDRRGIEALQQHLEKVRAKTFVLISTIDVYDNSTSQADESVIPPASSQPYGRHRRALEEWVSEHFPHTLIVRLPALFGHGLKKNIIFDLLTLNQTEKIVPNTEFQWYDLGRLWRDIERARSAGLTILHLMPEPLATGDILRTCFSGVPVATAQDKPARYDICTRHAALFGGTGRYIQTSSESLAAIERFVGEVRAGRINIGTPAAA